MSVGVATIAQQVAYGAHMFQGTPLPTITAYSLALTTSLPTKGMSNADIQAIEPTYTTYSRGQLNPSPTNWAVNGSTGEASNSQEVQIGSTNPNGPATCVGWALLDQNNVVRWYGALDATLTIAAGDLPPIIAAGKIKIKSDL